MSIFTDQAVQELKQDMQHLLAEVLLLRSEVQALKGDQLPIGNTLTLNGKRPNGRN